MQVSVLSIIFMCVSAAISIGAPVFLFLAFRKKYHAKIPPMLLGIGGFIIFALVLESSVHRLVFAKFALKETPALYIVYGIFMAGIFEETARFIAFSILKRKYKAAAGGSGPGIGTGLSYGIGHGGAESVLLAGVSMIITIAASVIINTGNIEIITSRFQGEALAAIHSQIETLLAAAPYMFLISGIERIMAIGIQLSLSIMVFYAVYGENKVWLYPLAVLLHAVIDIPAAAMQAGVLKSVFLVEGIICLFTVAIMLFAKYVHKKSGVTPVQDPSP